MEEYLQEEIPKELQMMKNTRWKSRDPILPSNLILEDAQPETKGSSSISKFKEKRQRLHYDNHPRTYAKFILLTLVLFGLYNCINCIIDINCYYWYCHCFADDIQCKISLHSYMENLNLVEYLRNN